MHDGRTPEPYLNSIPLEDAVLCADCEVISDSSGEACEACGSRSLLSLGRVLGCIEGKRAVLVEPRPDRLRSGFSVLVNADATLALQRRRKTGCTS